MNKNKKQTSFMGNVAIILFSQILVKLLGAVYKVVITNIDGFGNKGLGFYSIGFQIYTLLLAISSVGIPNAVSKMTSERIALNDYAGAHRIFKTAVKLFSVIGLLAAAILFFGADIFAHYVIKVDGSQYVMRALAPSLFFVCVSSVIRGYFTGMQDMKATSTSQVIEQIFKCVLTIVFVYASVGLAPEIMASWANFATSVATVISLLYLIYFYYRRKSGIKEKISQSSEATIMFSTKRLMLSILMISIPISLGSIITAVNRVIDTATISRGIEAAFSALIPAHGNVSAIFNPTAAQLNDEVTRLSGLLSKSDTLYNMPLAVNFAFATVLVPSIAGALAVKNYKEAAAKINYSFLVSTLIILPCAIGLIVLAQPIYNIIYFKTPDGADLLQLVSVSLIFAALNQTMTGALQGIGKVYTPAISLIFGCIAKVVLNLILIRIPSVNIYGAAISSIACQLISFVVCFAVLAKNIQLKMTMTKYVIKPLAAGIIMGGAAAAVYKLASIPLGSGFSANLAASCAAIFAAVIVYFFMVIILKILSEEEVTQLPAGNKLLAVLKKAGFYRNS